MTDKTMLSVIRNYFSPLNTTLSTTGSTNKSNWQGRVVALLTVTGLFIAYAIFRMFKSNPPSKKASVDTGISLNTETPLPSSSAKEEPSPIPVTPPRPAAPTPESPQQSLSDSPQSTSTEEQHPTPIVEESPDEEKVEQADEESENETDEEVARANESPETTPTQEVDSSSEADNEESDSDGLTAEEQQKIQQAIEQTPSDDEDEDTSLTPSSSCMQATPIVAALGKFSSLALKPQIRQKLQNQAIKTVRSGLAASPRREPVKPSVNSPETDFRKLLKAPKTN